MYASDLDIPHAAKTAEKSRLSKSEIRTLFTSCRTTFFGKPVNGWYINAYRFFAVVGMRPGELCELKYRQPDKASFVVDGNYNRFGEHTDGKTNNAKRVFTIPELGASILEDQRLMLKKAGMVSMYMFPDQEGEQATSREIYKRWQRYQIVNGIHQISTYELRHTFVSVCKSTVPEELIKPVLGHSSKMPSYHTYGSVYETEVALVAKMIDDAYTKILAE